MYVMLDLARVTKCIANHSQRKGVLASNIAFIRCTLLTRWSALVLTVGVSYRWKVFKRKLTHTHNVAVTNCRNLTRAFDNL